MHPGSCVERVFSTAFDPPPQHLTYVKMAVCSIAFLFQYSGWSSNNKEMYYPAPIVFKMQNRKETIVEFQRDAIKE
jgi:hypothetical protein